LLALVPIFDTLTADKQKSIAPKLNLAVYDRGETLVGPGRVLNALFLIGRECSRRHAMQSRVRSSQSGSGPAITKAKSGW
jgi:signal-transduction protein with cAMP-binding, CBS, and nucleotidyltransferase domain